MPTDHEDESPSPGDERGPSRVPAHGRGKITPFRPGDPVAARGRRLGQAAQREAAVLRRAKITELRDLVADAIEAHPRERLGPAAAAAASSVIASVLTGDVRIRHGEDAAALIRVLVDVARLESGDATSHTLNAHLSPDDTLARIRELRDRARLTLLERPPNPDGTP